MNKYLAIIKKELRYIIPLTIMTVSLFAVIAMTNTDIVRYGHEHILNGKVDNFTDPEERLGTSFLSSGILEGLAEHFIYLLVFVGTLAVMFALIQFWVPSFTGIWKFALHRPVKRYEMIITILATSMVTLFLVNGLCWTVLCRYIDRVSLVPVESHIYLLGWKAGIVPLLCYATAALCGMGRAVNVIRKVPIVLGAFVIAFLPFSSSYTILLTFIISIVVLIMECSVIVHDYVTSEY